MIQKINYFFTRVFDVILYPFSFINEFWGIFFLSIIMSFIVLWIYRLVSSPRAIKATKNKIKASILSIRIYKDLGKVIVASFFKSLFYTFKYFILNFGPVLIIIPILFPTFVQMDIRYGMQPFKRGDAFVVKARFASDIAGLDVELLENEHYKLKMNPVFIKALKEINWKVEALKPGTTNIKIKVGDKILEKQLIIGESRSALSNKKMRESSLAHFLYPTEELLPEEVKVADIYIQYPGHSVSFAGISTHWLVFNLILVVIIVLAFKSRFGVEF